MNLYNLSRHSGLDPESSGFNDLLDTGLGFGILRRSIGVRRYDVRDLMGQQ